MNYRNTAILKTILATLLFSVAFAIPVYAQNLVVDFVPDPLFEQNNFLPEDTSEGTVTVTNNSGLTQTVLTESINGFDSGGLGDHLNLTIVGSDSTTYFDDPLGKFLTNGEFLLGTLDNGESETYTFTVSFTNIDDNDFQEKSLGFDVCVGFEGSELNCGGTVGTGGGGPSVKIGSSGGGGGPIIDLIFLEVFDEEVTEINADDVAAVIEWDSNLLSTSQVIYGKESEGPYSLNLTVDPYFGYPLGTVEDPTKVTHHIVLLTGLEADEVYVYRVVSRSSPPTVGFQHVFALNEEGGLVGPSTSGTPTGGEAPVNGGTDDGGQNTGADGAGGSPEVQGSTGATIEVSQDSTAEDSTRAAALGLQILPDSLSDWLNCIGIFLIFVVIIYVAWILWRNRNRSNYTEDELKERRNLFFLIGSLIAIFIAYLLGWGCTIIPLAVLAVISLILYLSGLFINQNKEDH